MRIYVKLDEQKKRYPTILNSILEPIVRPRMLKLALN